MTNFLAIKTFSCFFFVFAGFVAAQSNDSIRIKESEAKTKNESIYKKAMAKHLRGDYAGAIREYDRILETNPKLAEAYYLRGLSKVPLKDLKGAELDYSKAIAVNPDEAKYYYSKGLLQKDEMAIIYFDKALRLKPDYYQVYISRANSKVMLYQDEEALKDLDKAIDLKPLDGDKAWAHEIRGNLKIDLEDFKGAVYDLTIAIELTRESASLSNIYHSRGLAYELLTNYDMAIKDYSKSIKLNHENRDAYGDRAICKCRLNDPRGAHKDWAKSRKLGATRALEDDLEKYCQTNGTDK